MITYANSGDIKIANIAQVEEYDSVADDTDLIVSDVELPESYIYPTKISFTVDTPTDMESFLSGFPSSKRSSILKRQRDIESKFELRLIKPFTQEQFLEWLAGYQKFMASLSHGVSRVESVWYDTGHLTHMGLFIYDKLTNKLAGGMMIRLFDTSKASMSYAWYNEAARKTGASTAAFLYLVDYCIKNNIPTISFGQDANLYGGHLSIGLHEYKTGWHGKPTIPKAAEMKFLKVRRLPQPENPIIFYTQDNNQLTLIKLP